MPRTASSKAIQRTWEKVYREGWYCATCTKSSHDATGTPPYRNCLTEDYTECPGIPKHMLEDPPWIKGTK